VSEAHTGICQSDADAQKVMVTANSVWYVESNAYVP